MTLRTLPIACALALAVTAPAAAADLFTPRAPAFGPYNWSGFYLGANAGFGTSHATGSVSAGGLSLSAADDLDGAIGGIQAGYNWHAGFLLFGLESDFQFSSQEHSFTTSAAGVTLTTVNSIPWFATMRGRAGFTLDQWLVYATGGVAFSEIESEASASVAGATSSVTASSPQAAWVLGAGIETALWSSNWTGKIEYLHIDSVEVSTTRLGINANAHATNDIVRLGVNYRFGGGR